jgi:hypothetical protein
VSTPTHPNRRELYLAATILAMFGLNQFPFAAPIYFAYTVPLGVIAACSVGDFHVPSRGRLILPFAACALLFAVLSLNRGYLQPLGRGHEVVSLDTPLNVPRAHLRVSASDAELYGRVLTTIAEHIGSGTVVAGPDCPEIAFLSERPSRDTTFFEFLGRESADGNRTVAAWSRSTVIAINRQPDFSPAFSESVLSRLRLEFPGGETIGRFEVRWRQ